MSAKRYTAIGLKNYLLGINIPGGSSMTLRFNTGYGSGNDAYFITTEKTLQEALENDPRYNKVYLLTEIDGLNIEEYNVKIQQLQDSSEDSQNKNSDTQLTIDEITTVGAARKYLLSEFKVRAMNRNEVFEYCEKFNIQFPNLSVE